MKTKEYSRDPGDDKNVTVHVWKLSPTQWRAIRSAVSDPMALRRTYREWKAQRDAWRARCIGKGYVVRDMAIDLRKVVAWCRREGLPVTTKSISRYDLKRVARAS